MKVTDFQSIMPGLRLEEYFQGRSRAWGLFEDRFGNVRSQFWVAIDGNWDGEKLTLEEDFVYSNGDTEQRTWTIDKTGENSYRGITDNVIGEATGEVAGNAFNWRYAFNLPVGNSVWKVDFDDWMFLQGDGVLLNKARVKRWGITIGTVFISFSKQEEKDDLISIDDPANEAGNRDTLAAIDLDYAEG